MTQYYRNGKEIPKVPYYKVIVNKPYHPYPHNHHVEWHKLNITGKRKIVHGPTGAKEYVRHRIFFLFTKWIPLEDIEMRTKFVVEEFYDWGDD